ncbi:MAG: endo-1,4-beta-xylanase [Eubacteriales bacterium]
MSRQDTLLKYFEQYREETETRIRAGIELYRKGQAAFSFVNPAGEPVTGVSFRARLRQHDFRFGCNIFLLDEFETEEKNALYREMFGETFNYAIVPFYWNALEPERGKPRYGKDSPKIYRRPAPDLVVEYCREKNIRMKGHCLVYDSSAPSWLPADVPGIKRETERHIAEVAERYAEVIPDWDIINETLLWNPYDPARTTRFFREPDYVQWSFDCAKRYLPLGRRFINEASGIWNFQFNRTPYYMQIQNLLAQCTPIGGIGLQAHQFVPRAEEGGHAARVYNPRVVYDLLDTFAGFGLPLQMSELTFASYNGDATDYELQGEVLRNMYRIYFSHPAMDGIVYWNLVDGYTWAGNGAGRGDMSAGENVFGGGLLYPDLSPKPAFRVLQELVKREWHTDCRGETGAGNRAAFRGFKGTYDITAEVGGKRYQEIYHLDGIDSHPATIVLA